MPVRPAPACAVIALCLLSPVVCAETGGDVGEVVVTATAPVVEETGTVREIDRETLDSRHAQSLDEALEGLPGVNVRTGGQGTPRIDVRGLRTRHVKLLVDGIPLNGASDGQFDPTLLSTDWMSRVKLTTGASSQLYGDGALGGVLNVITRRGAGPLKADIEAEGGELGSSRYGGRLSWGDERADVFFSLGRRTRDSYGLADDFQRTALQQGDKRSNSDLERNSAFLHAGFRPDAAWEFGLNLQYDNGRHGLPTGIFDNAVDIYAQRPRFDRVNSEDNYYAQLSAQFDPGERWSNKSWVYVSAGDSTLTRSSDDRFLKVEDSDVRNTFLDHSRTRVTGAHHQTTFSHPWVGEIALMVEARQEQLDGECLIQDVPLSVPPPPAAPAPPPPVAPTTLILDYSVTLTNGTGVTSAAGGNAPVARLKASNRPGGGVDFSITNLAGTSVFGASTFLQSVFLSPVPGFKPAGLKFSQAAGSQGDIGNVRFFQSLENADGYKYPIQVNFRRPGQGNPLLQGETGSWLFNKGTVLDYFGSAVQPTSGTGAPMFSAVRFRGTNANGFWGVSPIDLTGGGAFPRVFVGAPKTVDPNAAPPAPLAVNQNITGQLVQDRVCGGGAGGGDGSGGGDGDGTGGNRVERLPGFVFGQRTLRQQRAIEVFTTALEWSGRPRPSVGLVAGVGQHWLNDDSGHTSGQIDYNFGSSWRLTERLVLKASHAHKARPPSIAQLYDPASGNTGLGFERADVEELGLKQSLGRHSSLELTFFRQDVHGLIQRDALTGIFENVAEVRINGLEFAASTRPLPALLLTLGLSHQESRDKSPGTQRKEQQYTPENMLSLTGDYQLGTHWSTHLGVMRVGEQSFYSRVTPLSRRELQPYVLLDTSVKYSPGNGKISLWVGAKNLLDADYAESYGLPQPGRAVYAGISLGLR